MYNPSFNQTRRHSPVCYQSPLAAGWLILRYAVKMTAHAINPRFLFPPLIFICLHPSFPSDILLRETKVMSGFLTSPLRCILAPFLYSHTGPAICFHPNPGRITAHPAETGRSALLFAIVSGPVPLTSTLCSRINDGQKRII